MKLFLNALIILKKIVIVEPCMLYYYILHAFCTFHGTHAHHSTALKGDSTAVYPLQQVRLLLGPLVRVSSNWKQLLLI